MQTIINYTHGASGGNLSKYALAEDQEVDVINGTISENSITLIHRNGTNTDLPIITADNLEIDALF